MHELEAVLFAFPEQTGSLYPYAKGLADMMRKTLNEFQRIENINGSETTNPAARIDSYIRQAQAGSRENQIIGYNKRQDLVSILRNVPKADLLNCCQWLRDLNFILNP